MTVTNTGGCSSTCSKQVTVATAPDCTITGSSACCAGGTVTLCAPAGQASYLWSTGATTQCITVNASGAYSVTVTNTGGCSSTCSKQVTVATAPNSTITGSSACCISGTVTLCAPAGQASYLWSNGKTTQCITVGSGTYSVTVTNSGGCSSTSSKTVTATGAQDCYINGTTTCSQGGTTTLCAPAGMASYLWSNGKTTQCITVGYGTYSVTITNANGCSSTCSKTVTYDAQRVNPLAQQANSASTTTATVAATVVPSEKKTGVPVAEKAIEKTRLEASAYPNPFVSSATIEFKRADKAAHTLVEIYSIDGLKISTLFDNEIKPGVIYKAAFNRKNMVDGVYIYRIVSGDDVINGKLFLVK